MIAPAPANETANNPPQQQAVTPDTTGRRKRGAPKGNSNAMRHGLYSPRSDRWLSTYGARQASLFRRFLEETIIDRDGEVGIYAASLIQTATEAVRLATANRELLADGLGITIEQRNALDSNYARFLETRDRKLKELGLNAADVADDDPLGLKEFKLPSAT